MTLSVRGFFAVGHFSVKKNVSFGQVRLGQVRLGSVGFCFTANCPSAKNPRADVIGWLGWFSILGWKSFWLIFIFNSTEFKWCKNWMFLMRKSVIFDIFFHSLNFQFCSWDYEMSLYGMQFGNPIHWWMLLLMGSCWCWAFLRNLACTFSYEFKAKYIVALYLSSVHKSHSDITSWLLPPNLSKSEKKLRKQLKLNEL